MTPTDKEIEALVARLNRKTDAWIAGSGDCVILVNPDGPEAATFLTALQAENARLRTALEPFADVATNVPFEPETEIVVWVPANERNGGRWTAHMPAENFIDARAALAKETDREG